MGSNHINVNFLGLGPDAFFFVGKKGTTVNQANSVGHLLAYPENDNSKPLGIHNGSKIKLNMPSGVSTKDLEWLSVWCRKFSVNFGYVNFPEEETQNPTKSNVQNEGIQNGAMPILSMNLSCLLPCLLYYLMQTKP